MKVVTDSWGFWKWPWADRLLQTKAKTTRKQKLNLAMEHNKRKNSKKMIHPLVHQGPYFRPIEYRQTLTKIWKIGNTCNIVRCTRDSFHGVWLSEVVTSYEVAPWDKPGIGKTSLVSARKVKFANLQHECGNMFCLQATPWWMLPSTGPMSAFLTSFPPKSILTNMFDKKCFLCTTHLRNIAKTAEQV